MQKNAGEIEARDVSNRLDLNAEQRKNTRPDIDRTDVVFADGGVSYYIGKVNSKKRSYCIDTRWGTIPHTNSKNNSF